MKRRTHDDVLRMTGMCTMMMKEEKKREGEKATGATGQKERKIM
jgi:hypothetical protein